MAAAHSNHHGRFSWAPKPRPAAPSPRTADVPSTRRCRWRPPRVPRRRQRFGEWEPATCPPLPRGWDGRG
eukprot:s4825_g3.t1